MNREDELNEIKNKPDVSFCSCGLETAQEYKNCPYKGCKDNNDDKIRINALVESGWLPVNRWRHTY